MSAEHGNCAERTAKAEMTGKMFSGMRNVMMEKKYGSEKERLW